MAIIDKPSDYFNTKLYTGNSSTNAITGVGFQPDLVWIKDRDDTSFHTLFDSIRGATKRIFTNSTDAEDTVSNSLTSFDSDGFTLGSHGGTNSNTNHVSWNWKAGGTASSNTDGSITSNVSASTTSGFSIVSYTGTGNADETVGHGLGVAPSMIIVKRRSGDAGDWRCYHKSLGEDYLIRLNLTNASLDNPSWNDTAPTSSVFSIGTNGDVNTSGGNHIAYCFAEKQGFSKFGSYIGNGSASDGTFVYTGGMKPAFVMIKRTDAADGWIMFDNKRSSFNIVDKNVQANSSNSETTYGYLDFTSNGFKLRMNGASANGSGANYIYMCFAENPFVSSTGVPATAR